MLKTSCPFTRFGGMSLERAQLGCAEDSPPDPDEHLMIVFHDILLRDEHKCIDETYTQRRRYLYDLVEPVSGRAEIGEQTVMNFTVPDSATRLAHQMAFAVTQQWEGLVLKACKDPYVGVDGRMARHVKLENRLHSWLRRLGWPRRHWWSV